MISADAGFKDCARATDGQCLEKDPERTAGVNQNLCVFLSREACGRGSASPIRCCLPACLSSDRLLS